MEQDDDQWINLPIGQALIEPEQEDIQNQEDNFLQNFQNLDPEEIQQDIDSIEPNYFLNLENESRCVQFIKGTNLIGYRDKKCLIVQDVKSQKITFRRKLWCAFGVLAISHNNQYLAADGKDLIIHIWNLNKQDQKPVQLDGHSEEICSIAFSQDNKYLYSGGQDGFLVLWDMYTFQKRKLLKCDNHIKHISAGNSFVTLSSSGCYILLYNIKNGKISKLHQINHLYVCQQYKNGKFYISGDQIGKCKMWTKKFKQIRCRKFPGYIWRLDVSSDFVVASCFLSQQIYVLSIVTFQTLKKLKQQTDWTTNVTISDDQKTIVASDDRGLRVWNI